MRVPVQSQPVMRVPNHARSAANGVLPAGDCGKGYWCCNGCDGPICMGCDTGLTGHCLDNQYDACMLAGWSVSHDC